MKFVEFNSFDNGEIGTVESWMNGVDLEILMLTLRKTYKPLYSVEGNEWNVFAYGDGVSKKVELRIFNG
jgi:hypothetical protein